MARKVQTLRGVEKEGHEPSHLEQFRFQHLQKDWSDKLSSEVAEQVYIFLMKENYRMKHVRGLNTLWQHLGVYLRLKIMLPWKTRCIHKCLTLTSMKNVRIWMWDDQI
ncbi:hypothetical protein GOBAR_AA31257 [Gossypium barbadense]|uniref:Uncharacterized protein n=1 Tax=Gossypium barbadense TaxID=3634 RepID=A0A2P5WEB7_GOSBA|nr:hypothetical protein GOBAR_AA31257 [Gossypium barbadense]